MDIHEALDTLGISMPAIIKEAYRTQSKTCHPDCGGEQKEFIKIKQAYDYLNNQFGSNTDKQNISNQQQTTGTKKEIIKQQIITEVINLKSKYQSIADFYKYIEGELRAAGYKGDLLYVNNLDLYINKYYLCIVKFRELYIDTNTYQLRGQYIYKVWKDNGKYKQKYVGKELPESACGELSMRKRKAKCLGQAIEYGNYIFS